MSLKEEAEQLLDDIFDIEQACISGSKHLLAEQEKVLKLLDYQEDIQKVSDSNKFENLTIQLKYTLALKIVSFIKMVCVSNGCNCF